MPSVLKLLASSAEERGKEGKGEIDSNEKGKTERERKREQATNQ